MRKNTQLILFLLIAFILSGLNSSFSQEIIKPRLSLSYFKKGESKRNISVRASARINKRTVMIDGVQIGIYHTSVDENNFLGKIETNNEGSGNLILPESFKMIADTTSEYIFIGVIEDQSEYSDIEKEIEIIDASLKLNFLEEDSTKIVDVTIVQNDLDGNKTPVEDIEIKIFVKRPFGDLPIAKEELYSDEDGNVQIYFPDDLPGDSLTSLLVIARVEDDDTYGNLEISQKIDWGVAHEFDDDTLKRSLWAAGANAPLWLMLFTNSLIAVVWGIIFYIIHQIYKIYKMT